MERGGEGKGKGKGGGDHLPYFPPPTGFCLKYHPAAERDFVSRVCDVTLERKSVKHVYTSGRGTLIRREPNNSYKLLFVSINVRPQTDRLTDRKYRNMRPDSSTDFGAI